MAASLIAPRRRYTPNLTYRSPLEFEAAFAQTNNR
jgi:hypothetical protein